jgi:hypothetical protein
MCPVLSCAAGTKKPLDITKHEIYYDKSHIKGEGE